MPELHLPERATSEVCPEDLFDSRRQKRGAVHVSAAPRRLVFRATVPMDICLRWLRENSRGLLRSYLPVQFPLENGIEIEAEVSGLAAARVWRAGQRVHVSISAAQDSAGPMGAAARVVKAALPDPDPLLSALLGIHPLEWFREALLLTGSRERPMVLGSQNVTNGVLERLAGRWRMLSLEQEARAWSSLGTDAAEAREFLGGDEELVRLAAGMYGFAHCAMDPAGGVEWTRSRLGEFPGIYLARRIDELSLLRDRVFAKVAETLAARVAMDLAHCAGHPGLTLVEASFPDSRNGLARCRELLENGVCGKVSGTLVSELRRRRCIEIELPFSSRDDAANAPETYTQPLLGVEGSRRLVLHQSGTYDAARQPTRRAVQLALAGMFAHRGERWDTAPACVFECARTLDPVEDPTGFHTVLPALGIPRPELPERPVQASLSLTLAGEWFSAWSSAPHARQPEFGSVFERVGRRLQGLLRAWLPALWFNSVDRFAMLEIAYPLVMYAATPGRVAGPESGFTYDTTLHWSIFRARKGASAALPAVLGRFERRLRDAGQARLSEYFAPARTRDVMRACGGKTGLYLNLLRNEGYLMEELIRLSGHAREMNRTLRQHPSRAGRWLAQASGETARRINQRLSGMLEGASFVNLGPLIIMEATIALAGEPPDAVYRAELRAEWDGLTRVWRN